MNLSYSYRPKNSVKFSQSRATVQSSGRKRARGIDDIEFTSTRQRSAGILKKAKKKKVTLSKKKKMAQMSEGLSFKQKIFWIFVGVTILRLFFMDRGIWDFYQNKMEIQNIQYEISRLQTENKTLIEEIRNIRYDSTYQKKMARQHLGVIARDEYLILFAEEKALKSI